MPELSIPQAIQLARQWLQAGRAADVERLCRQILAGKADADALQLLASALLAQNRRAEAAQAVRALIQLSPNSAEVYHNLGLVLTPIDRDGAIEAYRQVISRRPDSAEALNNLGDLLRQRGDADAAAGLLEKAVSIRADFVQARFNLALCRFQQNRLAEAESLLRSLLAEQPKLADAHHTLGNVWRALNRPADALAAYENALALKPDLVEARWHAALAMLTLGDFAKGWLAHEWRRHLQGVWREPSFQQPQWRGEDLQGRRILLWTEQGFGDAIQFIRYASVVAQRGGRVSVLCQPELARLFRSSAAIERLFTTPQESVDFDLHAPLMSLPAILQTTLDTVPATTPYLFADPASSEKWAKRLPSGRKFGLAWASYGRDRWIPADELSRLSKIQGVTFCSLQKGGDGSRPNLPILDFTSELHDFADTAALIANLDLVVTCDTAVAHLAGAMGKPTWIMLPYASPWRWMLDRSDSPWYPTVRLFRQPRPDDWTSPISDIVKLLAASGNG